MSKRNINNLNVDDDDNEYIEAACNIERDLNQNYISNSELIGAALQFEHPLYEKHREINRHVSKFNYTLKMIEYHAKNKQADNIIDSLSHTQKFIENLVTQFVAT